MRKRRPLAKKLAIGGGIAFVAGMSLTPTPATVSTSSPIIPAAQNAKSSLLVQLKAVDPQISRVELAAMNVWIGIDLNETWSPKQYPFAGAMVIREITKALQAGQFQLPAEAQYLQIQMTVPTTGRLGEEGRSRIISLRLKINDLRKANLGNMTEPDLLNIADEVTVSGRSGGEVIEAYCGDSDFGPASASFCRNAS